MTEPKPDIPGERAQSFLYNPQPLPIWMRLLANILRPFLKLPAQCVVQRDAVEIEAPNSADDPSDMLCLARALKLAFSDCVDDLIASRQSGDHRSPFLRYDSSFN
jgi:hypothetical protein